MLAEEEPEVAGRHGCPGAGGAGTTCSSLFSTPKTNQGTLGEICLKSLVSSRCCQFPALYLWLSTPAEDSSGHVSCWKGSTHFVTLESS